MGQILAVVSAIFWGISNVFARKGMEDGRTDRHVGLFITLLVNNIVNLVFLVAYILIEGGLQLNARGVIYFALGGSFNSFAGRGLLFLSISRIGAARAGVIKVTTPLFAIFGGIFLLNEVMSGRAWTGIAVILVGVFYIALETLNNNSQLAVQEVETTDESDGGSEVAPIHKNSSQIGIVLAVLASICLGSGNVFRKAGLLHIPSSLLGVSIGSFFALIFCTVLVLLKGKGKEIIEAVRQMKNYYFWSGLYTSAALYCLFLSLKLIPVSIANSIQSSEALFTMFASIILLGQKEVLTMRTFIGASIVISGVILLLTL